MKTYEVRVVRSGYREAYMRVEAADADAAAQEVAERSSALNFGNEFEAEYDIDSVMEVPECLGTS